MHIPTRRPRPGAGLHRAAPGAALALAVVLAWPAAASGQPRPADRLPEVLNPGSVVPPVQYPSAFLRYRGWGETPIGSWRDANDTVTRIGGWRVYTREAHAPEAPASAPSAPAARPTPAAPASGPGVQGPHGHHGAPSGAGARP